MKLISRIFQAFGGRSPSSSTHKDQMFAGDNDGLIASGQQSTTAPLSLSRAELVLLSQFRSPKQRVPSGLQVLWRHVLGMEPDEVITRFIHHGLIVEAPLGIQIESRMPTPDIKAQLKALGLKVSGKKAELARRLADVAPPGLLSSLPRETLWCYSEAGAALVTPFLEREAEVRREAEHHARAMLDQGNLEGAAEVAADYDARRLFPSVLSADGSLSGADPHALVRQLRLARSAVRKRPAALAGIPRDTLEKLVYLYSWSCLWGEQANRAPELRSMDIGPTTTAERAMLTLGAWVANQRALADYRRSRIKLKVEILPGGDCELAERHRGIAYDLGECPEIPMVDCRREGGCACCYSPVVLEH